MWPYIGVKLKPWHIPGTAGTHQRLEPGTLALPSPVGSWIKMTGALFLFQNIDCRCKTAKICCCEGGTYRTYHFFSFYRVHDCINAGTDKCIDVSIDGGKWFDLKKKKQLPAIQIGDIPLLPYSGWKNFPGYPDDIPKHFNRGHIHHHIVESVQFVNKDDISDESDDDIEDFHTAKPLLNSWRASVKKQEHSKSSGLC